MKKRILLILSIIFISQITFAEIENIWKPGLQYQKTKPQTQPTETIIAEQKSDSVQSTEKIDSTYIYSPADSAKAENFVIKHQYLLGKTTEIISLLDEDDIDKAIAEYESSSEEVQEILIIEILHLDELKYALDELRALYETPATITIYTYKKTIYCNASEYRIYDKNGNNVTDKNGILSRGKYKVKGYDWSIDVEVR